MVVMASRQRDLVCFTWQERLLFIVVQLQDILLHLSAINYKTFLWGIIRLFPRYLEWSAYIRGRRAFYWARRNVPAYAKFLGSAMTIPETDKQSYINRYSPESRCIGGRIPLSQVTIDESSGSTGRPYNWIRSLKEQHGSHLFISYFASYCFGTKPWITINAFSMGAWATGLNMGLAMQRNSIVKSTGPDIDKILTTLKFLGPKYDYLILGYPPFLKHLIDVANAEGFEFDKYNLNAMAGGEGMSEGLRDYLLGSFKKVYSGYGATDLEIGIAGETPLAVQIRRLARDNPSVRQKIFGNDTRLPMVFQYNPLMHYIEVNAKRELVFTITRLSLLSPRIRYNIHDEGGIAKYDQMAATLASLGYDIQEMATSSGKKRHIKFPFVWVYGRSDSTVSVMGANIYPEDLEQCLYSEPELAKITRSFCLSLSESAGGGVRPCFMFEIEVDPSDELEKRFSASMLHRLVEMNADFREAYHEYPETLIPKIELYPVGQGPFKQDAGKIKQARLIKKDQG